MVDSLPQTEQEAPKSSSSTSTSAAPSFTAPSSSTAPLETAFKDTSTGSSGRRILGASETSCSTLMDAANTRLINGIRGKCARTPELAIVVNLFDAPLTPEEHANAALQAKLLTNQTLGAICGSHNVVPEWPACVLGVSRVKGFKVRYISELSQSSDRAASPASSPDPYPALTLPSGDPYYVILSYNPNLTRTQTQMRFFQHVLTPKLVDESFSHLWTFDNDIDVAPPGELGFNLRGAVNTMSSAAISIAQPRVTAIPVPSTVHAATAASEQQEDRLLLHDAATAAHLAQLRKEYKAPGADEAAAQQSASTHESERQAATPAAHGTLGELDAVVADVGVGLRSHRVTRQSGEQYAIFSAPLEPAGCQAQLVPYIEQQAPLFNRKAWTILHQKMLSQLDDSLFKVCADGTSAL